MTKPDDDTLAIHPSGLTMVPDCPRREIARSFRELVEETTAIKLTQPLTHVGAAVGRAVHRAAEFTLLSKIDRGTLGSKNDCDEIAISELRAASADGLIWDEISARMPVAEGQVLAMTGIYRRTVAPELEVIAVEKTMQADVGGGFHLSGRTDALTIIPAGLDDLKTGRIQRANTPQLGAYGILAEAHGYKTDTITEHFIPRVAPGKTQPGALLIEYDPERAKRVAFGLIDHVKYLVRAFLESRDPVTIPANPNSMLCSPKFCPAWGTAFCREHKGAT